jgi:hypothetical protein
MGCHCVEAFHFQAGQACFHSKVTCLKRVALAAEPKTQNGSKIKEPGVQCRKVWEVSAEHWPNRRFSHGGAADGNLNNNP